jgi:hypothetical protein
VDNLRAGARAGSITAPITEHGRPEPTAQHGTFSILVLVVHFMSHPSIVALMVGTMALIMGHAAMEAANIVMMAITSSMKVGRLLLVLSYAASEARLTVPQMVRGLA